MTLFQTVLTVVATIATAITSWYALRLHRMKIQFEGNAKAIQEKQAQMLNEMSEFSRSIITQTLKVTPQYAFMPYQQMMPTPSFTDASLFDRRKAHFSPEKEILAESVVKHVADLIDKNENLHIILILDAGSTVYPMFSKLCNHPSFQFDRTKARRLKIITNNLPGVSDLIRHGRISDHNMMRTLFRCRILRGFANSQYEAVLSAETISDLELAIDNYRTLINQEKLKRKKIQVISVTTGNYISIVDGILARDEDHLLVKSKMLEVADDIFVLSPLGKLISYSCDQFNEALGNKGAFRYGYLPQWTSKVHRLHMVVTTRRPGYFAKLDPISLNTYFGHLQKEACDRFKENLIQIPFDPRDEVQVRTIASIMGLERALREYELPHQNYRDMLLSKIPSE
ncbi:MAG: DeoR/GlpR transcriptional regulator [Anaerolineales bacterium]|nr:DeoR/GlpR transcriptional regulator [Anaerolineales bacterium]